VVKLSGLGAEDGKAFMLAYEHKMVENHFDQIKFPYTSLRPSSFHSNWFYWAKSIKEKVRVLHHLPFLIYFRAHFLLAFLMEE
jgi:hypothetical protein